MDKKQLEQHMQSLQCGDIGALDGVYMQISRSVYLLSYSILRSAEKAKDTMQETFVKVTANIDKYKQGTNAAAWILKIARNLSYRTYANSKRNASLEFFGDIEDSSVRAEFWTDEKDLNEALCRLSAEEREVVTLYSLEGYKHREIAKIINKPLGTVLWIYSKAIKRLKRLLE